jgi:hypothetical protein
VVAAAAAAADQRSLIGHDLSFTFSEPRRTNMKIKTKMTAGTLAKLPGGGGGGRGCG